MIKKVIFSGTTNPKFLNLVGADGLLAFDGIQNQFMAEAGGIKWPQAACMDCGNYYEVSTPRSKYWFKKV